MLFVKAYDMGQCDGIILSFYAIGKQTQSTTNEPKRMSKKNDNGIIRKAKKLA